MGQVLCGDTKHSKHALPAKKTSRANSFKEMKRLKTQKVTVS